MEAAGSGQARMKTNRLLEAELVPTAILLGPRVKCLNRVLLQRGSDCVAPPAGSLVCTECSYADGPKMRVAALGATRPFS